MNNFEIKFAGLESGLHHFDFFITDDFIKKCENEEVINVSINVSLNLERTERILTLGFHFKGTMSAPCDRCLELITIPIDVMETAYITFGEDNRTTDDNLIILPENAHMYDVSNIIYETIILQKPMRMVHEKESDCNQDVVQRLHLTQQEETSEIDPRWEALKNIKTDN